MDIGNDVPFTRLSSIGDESPKRTLHDKCFLCTLYWSVRTNGDGVVENWYFGVQFVAMKVC